MNRLQAWGSRAFVAMLVLGVVWLGLPSQPPVEPWPSPSEASGTMAPRLAQEVGQAWKQERFQHAWQSAQVLASAFPQSPEAHRVESLKPRLSERAEAERLAQKWRYERLSAQGWGTFQEAQLPAERLGFSPDLPDSFLVVRTASESRFTAAFLVPGVRLPEDCFQPKGCLLNVEHTARTSPVRWVPVQGQDGWFQASNPQQLLGWLAQRTDLTFSWTGAQEPLVFESRGLDLPKMGLQAASGP